ncbi:MAG TPA: ATP synthase subunit I [Candidatus Angelobacter sp.]|jgi:hypothetical protein
MNGPVGWGGSAIVEERLSGAYRRILRVAIVLSAIAALAAALFAGWRSGLCVAIGSLVAYINFVWLHHGTERLVQRMLTPGAAARSRFRFAFPFPGRYLLVIAVTYVILKSSPRLLVGFIVGLILPIIASMGEGIYEALVISKIDQASD